MNTFFFHFYILAICTCNKAFNFSIMSVAIWIHVRQINLIIVTKLLLRIYVNTKVTCYHTCMCHFDYEHAMHAFSLISIVHYIEKFKHYFIQ